MSIHKEGYQILTVSLIALATLNVLLFVFTGDVSPILYVIPLLSVLLMAFLLFFFRAPERLIEPGPASVTSPADGKIVAIEQTVENEYFREPRLQISVFMSPFNMHSNRYPVSGIVKEVKYHPGKYLVAWHPKSSELNERSTVVIEMDSGEEIVVRQIAGALARRIVTYAKPGQRVLQGEELGFIKFGSRVDLFLPPSFVPDVTIPQKVKANTTRLGRL